LLSSSDLVLAQCAPLASHCLQWAKNVHVVPYGVNLEVFSQSDERNFESGLPPQRRDNGRDRELLSTLPRPIIGYVGGLHRHLDLGLLASMAVARPQWSWVCIGPAQSQVTSLSHLPNVHLLGNRPHRENSQASSNPLM
jgi:glycosyltransferase involved in cell wall biosynthesis